MKRCTIFLFAALALSACGDVMTSPARLAEQAADLATKMPPEQVLLTSGDTVNGGDFRVLGEIKTAVGKATAFGKTPTLSDGELKLRIEGAELGADAVINAQVSDVTICALSWGCRNISGTAVAFTD